MSNPHINTSVGIQSICSRENYEIPSRSSTRTTLFDHPYRKGSSTLDPAVHCALPPIRSLELITPMLDAPISNFGINLAPPIEPQYHPMQRSFLCSASSSFSSAYSQDFGMSSTYNFPSVEAYAPTRHTEWPHQANTPRYEYSTPLPFHVLEGPVCSMGRRSIDPQHEDPQQAVSDIERQSAAKVLRKQRAKRQCPECLDYFINLSTHRAVHRKPTTLQVCEVCQRAFVRRNDLARHRKKHWQESGNGKGSFMCPFKKAGDNNTCSHATGAFSRCDTYKNHLKSIHFVCPAGTRKDARNRTHGICGGCRQAFSGVDDWLNNHVKTKQCSALNITQ